MSYKNDDVLTCNSLLGVRINEFLKDKMRQIGKCEIVPSYAKVLKIVHINDGRVQIKTIYDTILLQKSTVTEIINKLVKLGYLKKETCIKDKRISYVIETEKAKIFQEEFKKIQEELSDKLFSNFSDQEKEEFIRLISKAVKNFT